MGELVGQALELLGQRRRAAVEDACERRAPPGDQGAFLSLEMGGAGFRRLTDGGAGVPGGYSGEDVAPVGAGEVGPHLRGGGAAASRQVRRSLLARVGFCRGRGEGTERGPLF